MPEMLVQGSTITRQPLRIVRTGTVENLSFGQRRKSWEEAVAETIDLWAREPSLIDDDEYPCPSLDVLHKARWAAMLLSATELQSPLRIVPTADGGIAFEWDDYIEFRSFTIHPDCSLDWKEFEFGSLTRRRRSVPMNSGADNDSAW